MGGAVGGAVGGVGGSAGGGAVAANFGDVGVSSAEGAFSSFGATGVLTTESGGRGEWTNVFREAATVVDGSAPGAAPSLLEWSE